MKSTLAACILVITILMLTGCGGGERSLAIWIGGAPQEVDYLETLIREFEDTTGITVSVVRQPTDSERRRQGLVTALNARQPDPDVFLMDVIWIGQFAHSKWLLPLDKYLARDNIDIDAFFTRVVDLVDRYEESLVALPVYVDAGLLYYRTDLLEQHDYPEPPETWNQLVEWSQAVAGQQASDFEGFVWQGAQYEGLVCNFLEFAASNNGGLVSGDSILIDTPENREALQFMQDLIHRYKISPPNTYTEMKEEEVRRTFQRGNALFERNWPYAWSLHQRDDSPVAGRVGISPLPAFPGGTGAATLGGWHIGISRYSDLSDQAWELVRFLTSRSAQKKLVLNLGWNPGREDLYTDPDVLEQLPHLDRLRKVFRHAVARPNLPYYTQLSRVIQRQVNDCLAGTVPPETALSNAQNEVDRIVASYE